MRPGLPVFLCGLHLGLWHIGIGDILPVPLHINLSVRSTLPETLHSHIHELRLKLHAIADASQLLTGDECGSGTNVEGIATSRVGTSVTTQKSC